MGLLDDAIREHLDLKRRSGADPADIERAEREALGPVRRGPEVSVEGVTPPDPVVEPEAEHLDSEEQLAPSLSSGSGSRRTRSCGRSRSDDELDPYEPAHAAGGDPLRTMSRSPSMKSSHRPALPTWRAGPRLSQTSPSLRRRRSRPILSRRLRSTSSRRSGGGRRCARDHAGVPSGRSGSRQALVRAAPAPGLRFRRLSLLDSIMKRGHSSVGRAPALQAGGHGFESRWLHSLSACKFPCFSAGRSSTGTTTSTGTPGSG